MKGSCLLQRPYGPFFFEQLGQRTTAWLTADDTFLPPRPLNFRIQVRFGYCLFFSHPDFGQPGVLVAENFHFWLILRFTTWGESPRRREAGSGQGVAARHLLRLRPWLGRGGGSWLFVFFTSLGFVRAAVLRSYGVVWRGRILDCARYALRLLFFVQLKVGCEGEAR